MEYTAHGSMFDMANKIIMVKEERQRALLARTERAERRVSSARSYTLTGFAFFLYFYSFIKDNFVWSWTHLFEAIDD